MDSITRLSQKILAERARNGTQQQPTPSTAPPPYSESDMDSDDEDSDDESSPVKLIVNAAHSIQGSNNLVPTSPTPLADATKFSTLLLHAVNQINAANSAANANSTGGAPTFRRPLKVDLTINCGITVIGDRNVIGNVGLRPKQPNGAAAPPPPTTAATTSTPVVAGAKRKSEESDPMEEPSIKKLAGGEAGDD